jgi:hypothetical protein
MGIIDRQNKLLKRFSFIYSIHKRLSCQVLYSITGQSHLILGSQAFEKIILIPGSLKLFSMNTTFGGFSCLSKLSAIWLKTARLADA